MTDIEKNSNLEGVETLRDIPNVTLGSESIAVRIPAKESAASDGGEVVELTHGELKELVNATATALCDGEKGPALRHGAIVTIVMKNTLPFILSFLGVTWSAAVAAPLNPAYTAKEYEFYMEDAKSDILLVPHDDDDDESAGVNKDAAQAAAESLGISVYSFGCKKDSGDDDDKKPSFMVQLTHKSGPQKVASRGDRELFISLTKEEESSPALEQHQHQPEPTDIALFLHTSGTTAKPKGVPLTHRNLITSINNIANTYQLTPKDAVPLIMPLFHVHGLMAALLTTLATGGTVILPPGGKFSAGRFWDIAKSATWITAVPTMYQVLLLRYETDFPKDDPPTIRFIRSCSASLAPSILQEIETKFGGGAPCLEAYAMTEASHQMSSNPLPVNGQRKPGTVGRGTGVEIAILDEKNQVITEPNTIGEVCIRGENVFAGYKGVPMDVNIEAFAGGYFHTGDQGKLDEDGYLTLTGRIKELINRGGEKISPLEVDAAMLSHPDVAEAVSFAMPHDKYGEDVAAAIVLKDEAKAAGKSLDEEQLKSFLSDKLSPFKIPAKVFLADELPKTATGKIQRRIVAEHFLEK